MTATSKAITLFALLNMVLAAGNVSAQGRRGALLDRLVNGRASRTEKTRVLRDGKAAIRRIVQNPNRVSAADKGKVGLLSPVQRAKALHELAGWKMESCTFAADYRRGRPGRRISKLKLKMPDNTRDKKICVAVMGENTLGFIPGDGHSYGMRNGKVIDAWYGATTSEFRAPKVMIPVWMTGTEGKRFDASFRLLRGTTRTWVAEGRPTQWVPKSANQRGTGNSCTTPFHRAPVGERAGWIADIVKAVDGSRNATVRRARGRSGLIAKLEGKSSTQIASVFTTLKGAMRGQSRQLSKLEALVTNYRRIASTLPLDYLGRQSLGDLAGLNSVPGRKGDDPGPAGVKKGLRASDSIRVGVEINRVRERQSW